MWHVPNSSNAQRAIVICSVHFSVFHTMVLTAVLRRIQSSLCNTRLLSNVCVCVCAVCVLICVQCTLCAADFAVSTSDNALQCGQIEAV